MVYKCDVLYYKVLVMYGLFWFRNGVVSSSKVMLVMLRWGVASLSKVRVAQR